MATKLSRDREALGEDTLLRVRAIRRQLPSPALGYHRRLPVLRHRNYRQREMQRTDVAGITGHIPPTEQKRQAK
jgi:hypothetical protein